MRGFVTYNYPYLGTLLKDFLEGNLVAEVVYDNEKVVIICEDGAKFTICGNPGAADIIPECSRNAIAALDGPP